MTRWQFSPAARRDLTNIWYYSADQWGAEQAEAYVAQIQHDLSAAAAGSPLVRRLGKYIRIKSGHHLCVLRPDNEGTLIVLRILHERMDVEAKFGASSG